MILSRRSAVVAGVAAALVVVPGCGDDDDAAGGDAAGPIVIATTGIWADVASAVACDGTFTVRALVPSGADPHGYEPSLRDRETLGDAAVVVVNGRGLEELLDDTLEQIADDGVPVVRMADVIDSDGGGDPHVWFDPTDVASALPALGDALVDGGADRASIDACIDDAQRELVALDGEVEQALAAVPTERRLLVTNHDSLGAFADRYGFEILGSVLPSSSTLAEASPGELAALGEQIEATGTPAIFTEAFHARGDADVLADRLGVEVVELYTDALGEPGSGADTYAGLMRTDAERIAAALGP